jgi:hypothetical protein
MIPKSLNRSLAKQDPQGTFDNPFVIVEEKLFTRGEKIATLDRWRSSIVDELSTMGEARRARLLIEIVEARHRLSRQAEP